MSSSVTVDWRAIREQERQTCLALRAELAQLRERERQLRLRSAGVAAVRGSGQAEIVRVGKARGDADSAELSRLVNEARAGLTRSAAALDRSIANDVAARTRRPDEAPEWTSRAGTSSAPAPAVAADVDLAALAAESRARDPRPAEASPRATPRAVAEADAAVEECRLRCPGADLDDLTRLRSELDARPGPAREREITQEIRIRAARTIQRVKRENELEERRERLFVLAVEAPPAERAALRRRVADAPPDDLPRLDREVTAAVERAAAGRSRHEAVTALEQSLTELGYDVRPGFSSLLPGPGSEATSPRFLVAGSPHSADHGLRVRVGDDQVYLSVVRRAGTGAGADTRATDTAVQEQTCADLVSAAERGADHGFQFVLGNAQTPGREAPQIAAEHWPAAASADTAVDLRAEEKRKAWAEQERLRIQNQNLRTMRPGHD
jgi:hypothetical protein